jgi:large subunit ribosomal protein L23
MKNLYNVLKGPRLTEKASLMQEEQGQVVFKVHPDVNKIEIKQCVEKMFNVKVKKVRTINLCGKIKRTGARSGRTSDWKKAYVTLSEGKISFSDEL